MSIIIYGIPNCDTIKKTITWFKNHQIDFVFHNYKKEGITIALLNDWCKQVSWETLLNKKGTTWRKLSPEVQSSITSAKKAIGVMMANPSSIKRPVITQNGIIKVVGFDEEAMLQLKSEL